MIRPLFLAIFATVALLAPPLCQGALAQGREVIDGIAAIVNGEVITLGQVRMVTMPRERLLRSQLRGEELARELAEMRKAALRDLIDRQLIVQAFKEEKLSLPDYFVEQRINEILRENFGGDRQAFIRMLEAQNFSLSEFRKNEFERIIVSAMRGKNVKPNTVASPVRIEQYYQKNRQEFTSKQEVKLRLIMIPSRAEDGNAAAQKAMAEEILDPVQTQFGWHVLKVEDKRGGATKPLAEVRTEIEGKLLQEEAQRLQENWLASLRQKATIRTF
jgi:peptidyl-prolyl cis-trans isomerase SurA